MMKLRDYQLEDLGKIKAKYDAGVRRQLVKWATGAGKTILASSLPDFMKFSGRMLFLDHRTELTNQALDKLKKCNPLRTVGVEMGDRRSNGEQLIVAGNATIGRAGSPRLLQFDPSKFDALVIDEAHHSCAQSYLTVINHFTQNPKLLVLGITATPNRADGTGLGKVFQEIVADRDILWCINHGWLVDLKAIRIRTGVDLSGVHTVAGDLNNGELGSTVNTPSRNDLIARSWLEHAQDRQTVIFCVDVQHSKDLADTFKRYGVSAEGVWGGDPDREVKLKMHNECKLRVLTNCQILTEGWDSWKVSCIGTAAPTLSEGRFTQQVGRGTRIPEGIGNLLGARKAGVQIAKDDCILLDFVDNTTKHSLVTLPTLFGLGKDTDLRGKGITKVVAEIEAAKKRNPLLDITRIDDIDKLQSYAEAVDLFKVSFPPEIIQLSKYQWHKMGADSYALALVRGEGVAVRRDLLDRWHIIGTVNQCEVVDAKDSFEEAIREADFKVGLLGGRGLASLARRAEFKKFEPPTPAQLMLCRKLRIVVPPGASKGEVGEKLTSDIERRKQIRLQRSVA